MSSFITVDHPGLLSLVVDKERLGFQNIGISAGGPADHYSCHWANKLVGNDDILPCIEVVGDGAQFTFSDDCTIAITGGTSEIRLNHVIHPSWQNFQIKSGDRLQIQNSALGIRHYIAVCGGLTVEPIFGSATAVTRDGLGGQRGDGSAVSVSEKLAYKCKQFPWALHAPKQALIQAHKSLCIDLVMGYQFDKFKPSERQQFFSNNYRLTPNSSRMAARFAGSPIQSPSDPILSEGIAKGALQIPPDGLPIVMLADRQTVGGYPKLGSVTSHASDLLAQACAGSEVQFNPIDFQLAHNKLNLKHVATQRLFSECEANRRKAEYLS
ncbi:MAG: biotin-dependent carboxyltransferase family protein [Aliiglaciecola sp.]